MSDSPAIEAEDNVTEFQPAEPEATVQVQEAPAEPETRDVGGVAGDRLRSFIERIERLEEEKAALQGDIKEIFAEAKGNGFDVKAIRQIIRIRKQDDHERKEQEAVLETYLHALGMLDEY